MNPKTDNLDPVPTDDPREISRVCPACKGHGFLILALGPHGEHWLSRECGLCLGAREITRSRAIQLWREVEGQR